jgi:hypothetical protein
MDGMDRKGRFFEKGAIKRGFERRLARPKCVFTMVDLGDRMICMYFSGCQSKGIVMVCDQVPSVSSQFSLNVLQKIGRAKQMKRIPAVQKDAKQSIKTREVVHMCVGHECVGYLQSLSVGKAMQVAHVEQQGPSLKEDLYE